MLRGIPKTSRPSCPESADPASKRSHAPGGTGGCTFFVTGDPKGQPRPRAFAKNLGGGRFSARVFDSGTAEGWKSLIAHAWHEAGRPTFDGAVSLTLDFYFKRPKSHWRKSGLKPMAVLLHHVQKPDVDNCAKAAADCLTQCGAWKDDTHITRLLVMKRWATESAGVQITIEGAT
jgi:Holliday junction resolvase RusA-like endonuclease